MRTAFFVLLLANIGYFAWNYLGGWQASGDAQLVDQQLHPEAIRLLNAEQLAALAAERPRGSRVAACLDLGPFSPGDVARVEQALEPLALGPKLTQRRVDEVANFWVYIPAQPSRQVAGQKTAELKRLGVEEFFVVQEDPNFRYAISLGVFRTEEAAAARLEQLRARGVRSAQVGKRETQVQKVFFTLRDVPDALAAKLSEVRLGSPGSELKECQPEEKR